MLFSVSAALERKLLDREHQHAKRELKPDIGLIDFCSNDYLGFARNPRLAALAEKIHPNDFSRLNGSTASRLLRGNTSFAEETESMIARYHYAASALMFNSGYDANLGFFSCVPQKGDVIYYDKLIHASVHDGMRLSQAESKSFRHNDLNHLRDQVRKQATGNKFVVAESVYSMDGDQAPLEDLAALAQEENFHLIIDEAHAIGVFGENGEGLVNQRIAEVCFARIYTYGKAMGSHGAAVVGSELLRDYLINFARSFIYTTALPPHSQTLVRAAYSLLKEDHQSRKLLHERIAYFKSQVEGLALNFVPGNSAIQSLIVGGNDATRKWAEILQKNGMDVRAILSPTVPSGQERLRICLHSFNTREEMEKLTGALKHLRAGD